LQVAQLKRLVGDKTLEPIFQAPCKKSGMKLGGDAGTDLQPANHRHDLVYQDGGAK
jgi:hypothetical protein